MLLLGGWQHRRVVAEQVPIEMVCEVPPLSRPSLRRPSDSVTAKHSPFRAKHVVGIICLIAGWLLGAGHVGGAEPRGLPFIRTYPLDEIGNVPRNLRLGFDTYGRVAVMYDGIYSVLNDSAWVDRVDPSTDNKLRMTTVKSAGDTYFYGGRGSWGTVDVKPDGRLRARPFTEADSPPWTRVTAFNQILITATGVYFYDYNGIVYWDFARRRNFYFELPRVTVVFAIGDRVLASCQDHQVREILPASGEIRFSAIPGLNGAGIDSSVSLAPDQVLLVLQDRRLVVFDGNTVAEWRAHGLPLEQGRISSMQTLVEGGIAIAVDGQGLFLLQSDGQPIWSLTLPEFRRVGAMAAVERGVLWVAGENAVHRLFYDSPLTVFGQQLGLTAVWPGIAVWQDRTVVVSNKRLFVLRAADAGTPSTFATVPGIPPDGADTIGAREDHFLLGNSTGVFTWDGAAEFTPLISIANVAAIEFIAPDTCLVLGSQEIAVLKFADGRWTEPHPRIGGVGAAPVRTMLHGVLWIEMGADRVARLKYQNGALSLQQLELPWPESQWTNTGLVNDTIILSGTRGQRAYYDDATERFCAAPADLDQLLNRSPYWISRVTQDASGTLWGTHAQGVVTFTPHGNDYTIDASTFHLPNDSYPAVNLLSDDNVWITTGRSLFHVEHRAAHALPQPKPILVSVMADDLNRELLQPSGAASLPRQFDYEENSLSFRFFSGTYAWRHPPAYEYRLNPTDVWSPVDPNLFLHFPKLRDGAYRLQVRLSAQVGERAPEFSFPFAIQPPWYRAPAGYALYVALAGLAIAAVARWINYRSLKRNADLERQVQERTAQLEAAMGQLAEESRNTATLAERSRLAGELHDSLQQGLSGSILQLDTTLNNGGIPTDLRSRLNIVRKMLSFTREEVQHAVWNLESPLLKNSNLTDALRNLVGVLSPGSIAINLRVQTHPHAPSAAVQHNLLRIAQEAITNAIKHAHATRIDVSLFGGSESLALRIADDGCGFDVTAGTASAGHFGLRGMRARARAIKSEIRIHSAPGNGTIVEAIVPVTPLSPQ